MAVAPRKRKGGVITFYVATSWNGGQYWERVGTNRREAEALDKQRLREVKAGTFRPSKITDAASVEAFARSWFATRTNRVADNDRGLIERHVLTVKSFASLRMGDVRPRDVLQLIKTIRANGKLAEKSISLVMGLVRVMFRDAVIDDVILSSPYVVPRGTLKKSGKRREPYTIEEARALMAEPVPERDRVWTALAFYTGARCGEVCGLTWGDWDDAAAPLGALSISKQYGGQPLKTERPRVVPVHPALAAILTAWKARWSLHYRHRPLPTDFIVPQLDRSHLTKSAAYKGWVRACKAAQITNRSVHSSRHTFITLARRGGARPDVLELVTHNPKGTIIDVYTTRAWAELCEVVLALQIDVPLDADTRNGSFSGSSSWTRITGPTENQGKSDNGESPEGAGSEPKSTGKRSGDAGIDASQEPSRATPYAWSLALAAESVLRGRTIVRQVTVVRRRRKGVA